MKKVNSVKKIFSMIVIIATIMTSLINVKPVAASTMITVYFTGDAIKNGDGCSLREAIIATNTNTAVNECPAGSSTSMDYINLQGATYVISLASPDGDNNGYSGDLDINDSLTITGFSRESTVVKRGADIDNFAHRIFHVRAGPNEVVTIANMTINRGNALNTVETASGGGILNEEGSVLNVTGVVFDSNVSTNTGGGIANGRGSKLYVNASSFIFNQSDYGGGIWNQGTAVVTASYFESNMGKSDGGGFYNNADSYSGEAATLENLTLVGNVSTSTEGGGGVSSDGPGYMENLTLYGNVGYGLRIKGGGYISNSIIANSTRANCSYVAGMTFQSYGGNLESPGTNTCSGFGQTPNVGLFRSGTPEYNGGQTKTLALAEGSPAIDSGTNEYCPSHDQRMLPRRWNYATGSRENGVCDIGAVEMGATYSDGVFLPVIKR